MKVHPNHIERLTTPCHKHGESFEKSCGDCENYMWLMERHAARNSRVVEPHYMAWGRVGKPQG